MSRISRVTLVGSPNSGKTTLYNWLTGSRHKTVNYPGSTVEISRGQTLSIYGQPELIVIDTPGTYSLDPKSPDEEVAYRTLFEHPTLKNPDLVVAVVDVTLLARHLLLVRQLQELGLPVVVALTMIDILRDQGFAVDLESAERIIGAPVVMVDGRLGGGVKELVNLARVRAVHPERPEPQPHALRLWDSDKVMQVVSSLDQIEEQVYRKTAQGQARDQARITEKLDRVLLHPVWGLASFLLIMGFLFTSIFWFAQPFMDGLNHLFSDLTESITAIAPQSLWADFFANGVVKGVGSVMVFIPQIMILFIGIHLLEATGYLARAATLVDRPLSKLGLNGRAFVPLLSAYACAIPAMLAARTISSRRERWLTLFVIPLMTCSARLPVYALLLSFLFFGQPAWQAGLALAILYLASFIVGSIAAIIAGRFLSLADHSFFMLELPIYRLPRLRHVVRQTLDRTWSYLKRAGPMIIVFSLLIWALTTFPNYQIADRAQRFNSSFAAKVGHVLEPIMSPMGSDWRVGVGLISAFAAREVFVSSMAIVFNVPEKESETTPSLMRGMQAATHPDGAPVFTTPSVVALILFFMIALQCMSTVAVAHRESGQRRFAILQLLAFNLTAYASAVLVYQGLKMVGL